MFVKLFTQILDSSLADDRVLRHFFTDLLLCADSKGYVIMTPQAIARRIGAPLGEVEDGLKRLSEPDKRSKTQDHEGRRIEALEGMGYGWRIVNYEMYRAMRDADQLRESTKERVRRYRQKKRELTHSNSGNECNAGVTHGNAITEGEEEADKSSLREESSAEADCVAVKKEKAPRKKKEPMSREAFITALKANPAYTGLDIDKEIHKMEAWLLTPKGTGRTLTRGFVVNWLNKCDPSLQNSHGTHQQGSRSNNSRSRGTYNEGATFSED